MKKIIGLFLYIISLLISIFWIYGIWESLFNKCVNCQYIAMIIPWWHNPSTLGFILGLPIIAFVLFILGKKLRK